jgi:hypothetical protein
MKKAAKQTPDEMRPEYQLSRGKPNPYAARFAKGSNVVLIEPDLFSYFPSSEEVNSALRLLVKLSARATERRAPGPKRAG